MIRENDRVFELTTANTTYAFGVTKTGHLEHLYYGKRISEAAVFADCMKQKSAFAPGDTCVYSKENPAVMLDNMNLEMSGVGKGDMREPFVIIRQEDGSVTSDFTYVGYTINKGKNDNGPLPNSYGSEEEVLQLRVFLRDANSKVKLELTYSVYEKSDVITRSNIITNTTDKPVNVLRLMSAQVDFDRTGMCFTTFNGAWAREMKKTTTKVTAGKMVNESRTGNSSNAANPFVMLSDKNTDEDNGNCYGFNLIYSGNHCEIVEVGHFGGTRFVSGINPLNFDYRLEPDEKLVAPEAVMSFSDRGFNGLSQNMHYFVNNHIVRGNWKDKTRPVLLNSWEAAYFDIDENRLLKLAKAGKEVGIELFVVDDGWFGNRDCDMRGLGDWMVNKKKFPSGLKGFSLKLRKLGMRLGIWVEPEMVNVDSELYKKHPDWTVEIPGKNHSEGRNQRILDLTKTEVVDHIIESMKDVFAQDIAYVKWDMNRNFTDTFSQGADASKQGGFLYDYYVGLYRCMKELTEAFPDILFEGCASGGNRFDLGILSYFHQIWASDDTDAIVRSEIQTNYSYGYPQSVISAHVSSCPNHQTLRTTPIETRFNVAAFGVLGFECNFCDMKKEDLEKVKAQIALYKEKRQVLQFGSFYRCRSYEDDGNTCEWICVSPDKQNAVGMLLHKLVIPNWPNEKFYAKGLDAKTIYNFYNIQEKYNIKNLGDLINTVAPVHIKQDGVLHNVASKFVKMDGEKEEVKATGDILMYAGVKLKQNFIATGYNEEVRYYPDFASRMYFIESAN